ncbi:glycine cleavage system protein GcvH [Chengkuizengella sp. SCS-71B]|uniref:glycine cleavage system protein GcvH n=1 Tax=Chengkuizengella sp. SCS-71B TaxID=3115290 RepID=UPI0032C235FD
MSELRENLAYSEDHEWTLSVEGQVVRIGITDYAQEQLGDIVFVEFPEVGDSFSEGDVMGTIESVKTVSEIYYPVSGKVTKINDILEGEPEKVNAEPYDGGWLVEVEVEGDVKEALSKLLTAEGYRAVIE